MFSNCFFINVTARKSSIRCSASRSLPTTKQDKTTSEYHNGNGLAYDYYLSPFVARDANVINVFLKIVCHWLIARFEEENLLLSLTSKIQIFKIWRERVAKKNKNADLWLSCEWKHDVKCSSNIADMNLPSPFLCSLRHEGRLLSKFVDQAMLTSCHVWKNFEEKISNETSVSQCSMVYYFQIDK